MHFSRKQTDNEYHRLNLSEVIQESYQLIKDAFDKKIKIQVVVPESLPVLGDHSELSMALMNLFTNARDAMPDGGQLRIEAGKQGNKAVVMVADTGMGMDSRTVEKCFDPFFTTKEIGKGTGLGLSTTYGIVMNHKGDISVDSGPNRGSVFKVSLPLSDIKGAAEQDEAEGSAAIVYGNGKKVLVVDDETEILLAVSQLLERLGYQAEISGSGPEAVEKYKSWHPDVVLMDINMPGMDGLTSLAEMSKNNTDLRAVVISGYEENILNDMDPDNKKFIKGFLVKPFGKYALSASLARALNKRD
jgi:CheY-like chemotaxis protein/anti-sigma regulatory factor (Ser/Thr protein kinase)